MNFNDEELHINNFINLIQRIMDRQKEFMEEFEEYTETDNGEKELD